MSLYSPDQLAFMAANLAAAIAIAEVLETELAAEIQTQPAYASQQAAIRGNTYAAIKPAITARMAAFVGAVHHIAALAHDIDPGVAQQWQARLASREAQIAELNRQAFEQQMGRLEEQKSEMDRRRMAGRPPPGKRG